MSATVTPIRADLDAVRLEALARAHSRSVHPAGRARPAFPELVEITAPNPPAMPPVPAAHHAANLAVLRSPRAHTPRILTMRYRVLRALARVAAWSGMAAVFVAAAWGLIVLYAA